MSGFHRRVGARFGAAAASYDEHSDVQRQAADRLSALVIAEGLPAAARVLEIGCGTGHLTRQLGALLPDSRWLATDISPAMVAACRQRLPALDYLVMDGRRPAVRPGFDLVCANLAIQWFDDLAAGIGALTRLLAPGGLLAVSTVGRDTFREWRAVHAELGLAPAAVPQPDHAEFRAAFPPGGVLRIDEEYYLDRPASALVFLRELRAIGADTPAPGRRPLSAGELRRVLRRFDAAPTATYHLMYGRWRRPRDS